MNTRLRLGAIASALLFLAKLLPGAELDPLPRQGGILWDVSGAAIQQQYPGFFRWEDNRKNRLRFNRVSSKKDLTLFAVPLQEVVCEYRQDQLDAIQVSVYNRGDAGMMSARDFEALVDRLLRETARQFGGGRIPDRRKVSMAQGRLYACSWQSSGMNITLRWSISSRNVPEYILLIFQNPQSGGGRIRKELKAKTSTRDLKSLLRRDPDGTVYMIVPMVDQGAKGYCAAATVARVLNYYGAEADQHLIAQLAQSDAEGGTGIGKLMEGLDRAQGRLGIRVKTYCSCLSTQNDWMKFIKEYNKYARRNKIAEIDVKKCYVNQNGTRSFSPDLAMSRMSFKAMQQVRALDRDAREAFFRQIRESVDAGLPLCWTTPGHMRLITGYQPKTGAVIYSDSWGAGHEKKVMSGVEAWSITRHLFGILPRGGSR